MVAKMSEERGGQYQRELRQATPEILSLARTLQRAAFWGERVYEGQFIPAPVYLTQATMILRLEGLKVEVREAVAVRLN